MSRDTLCERCDAIFRFRGSYLTQEIISQKREAIADVQKSGADDSDVDSLKQDLSRYEQGLLNCGKPPRARFPRPEDNNAPCPWPKTLPEVNRSRSERKWAISCENGWRKWSDFEESAHICPLCYQIVEMGCYSANQFPDRVARIRIIPDWDDPIKATGQLFQRGWTLQERLLSPRKIYMCRFPFWECLSGVRYELSPPEHQDASHYPQFERNAILPAFEPEGAFNGWKLIVEHYSRAKLTYPSDKLVAISGLAQKFAEGVKESYYGGIWGGKHLLESLLWVCQKNNQVYRPLEYRAPSWSWASIDSEILYGGARDIGPHETFVRFLSIHTSPKADDLFGQILAGHLSIRGCLFELPNEDLVKNMLRRGHLDDPDEDLSRTSIYIVPLCWQSSPTIPRYGYTSLILLPCEDHGAHRVSPEMIGQKVFRKIGLFPGGREGRICYRPSGIPDTFGPPVYPIGWSIHPWPEELHEEFIII
ncbi:uncharacterized protein LY89DRAFT_736809 [Mollisia scopiformis]|uniref:Heterokaryon incompatibility domain-containing protein n=1 Tax=Mollisia scopiformis TaxID=149040 RepID=A0A194X1U6_MOLSC|nr:uncharacterized protein LY89DRAFT_736809 [Mollisia scopiformis]KUJ13812.1 hypothetical protein LY89DRAFT_736809 [Mollisia scopiformis]